MYELDFFNGDHFITFDVIEADRENGTVTVVISNQGKITQDTFNLFGDEDNLYFEYGLYKIYLNEFEYL